LCTRHGHRDPPERRRRVAQRIRRPRHRRAKPRHPAPRLRPRRHADRGPLSRADGGHQAGRPHL